MRGGPRDDLLGPGEAKLQLKERLVHSTALSKGIVEVDETWVGPKERARSAHKIAEVIIL